MPKVSASKDKFDIKDELIDLANEIREAVLPKLSTNMREIAGRENGGDPHFKIDEIAERTVQKILEKWTLPIAYFSEDRGMVTLHKAPQWILVIDPIDGTRPAMANFESCCVSIAVAPYSVHPKFKDITNAIVFELKSGNYFYAQANNKKVIASNIKSIALSNKTDTQSMFWSTELTAHPVRQIANVCGNLIDESVIRGAVFVFTSSSFSLTRILTGQLDAHVDVGHRILKDNPALKDEFIKVGRGKIATLFPYDIAAAAFILSRAGGEVTDAYGQPLDELNLITNKSVSEQCSIIAAANKTLHENIINKLTW
jgi:myo-inositol-1(or 4)-monophosphatase